MRGPAVSRHPILSDPLHPEALKRFAAKCRFDPGTGCVLWIGGQTSGRGHSVPYGAFWFEGRRWFAHRWAAKYIHNLEIDELQVDHCCPNILYPNTLCAEHVEPLTLLANRALQTERRRFYALVTRGLIEPPPHLVQDEDAIPFYPPPAWFKRYACQPVSQP